MEGRARYKEAVLKLQDQTPEKEKELAREVRAMSCVPTHIHRHALGCCLSTHT
jgi:hypothetical protein